MTLSVAMIARNSAATLEQALRSVKDADEVVVCDTGSTDDTVDIATRAGATVVHFPWCDDFSAARNCALEACTSAWRLNIDSDEVLEDCGVATIKAALEHPGAHDAFEVTLRYSPPLTAYHKMAKVIREDVRFQFAVHEYPAATSVGSIATTVRHLPKGAPADPGRNRRILQKVLAQEPNDSRSLFYLGRDYLEHQEYRVAASVFEAYLTLGKGHPSERAEAYLCLARCLWQLQQGEQARQRCAMAVMLNPQFKEALVFMSEMVWPGHREQWQTWAAGASNEGVLFVRVP